MNRYGRWLIRSAALALLLMTGSCDDGGAVSGQVRDEASRVGRDAASFPAADEDYFHDMDGAADLPPDEVKGRDMWLVWTGGNDRFWDHMTRASFGALDLLKTLSS
jgi:hypothetical protein